MGSYICDKKLWYQPRPRNYLPKSLLAAWMTIVYSVFSQLWLALSLGHLGWYQIFLSHMYPFTMLLLFGLAHFYTQGVLFSISLLFVNINKYFSTLLVDYSHSIDHKQIICIKFQVHKLYWGSYELMFSESLKKLWHGTFSKLPLLCTIIAVLIKYIQVLAFGWKLFHR